jgi:transglutaminase-like putative cysteine protease
MTRPSLVLRTSLCLAAAFAAADLVTASPVETRRVEFVQEFRPAAKGLVELWIPTPLESPGYQRLVAREVTGNATLVRLGAEAGNPSPYVYVRWEGVAEPRLRIVNLVEVSGRVGALPGESGGERFLRPTAHVQTDGVVNETAERIVAGAGSKADDDAKARAIYDWIVAKAARDPDVRGCGLGDVKTTLTVGNLRGKCADLNSLFVGLARAAGIPAREVFGQRVASSSRAASLGKEGDNSKAQHCRAEYYSKTQGGWVPVDPADVRKVILEEGLAPDAPRVRELQDALFGAWEGTWVAFNYARDFALEGYDAPRLNYFMYPLLASAKLRPDGVDPGETGYTFSTRVLR